MGNKIKKFKVGETYSCNSVCDSECIWAFKVIKRTPKTIQIEDMHGYEETVIKIINIYDNTETVRPLGRYSMAPILRASKKMNN